MKRTITFLSTFFKSGLNNDNKTKIIGLLTILIFIWLVLYFIPELFVSLFNTLLGNLIIILIVLLVYTYNRVNGIIAGITLLLLYRFSQLSRENFTTDSKNEFLSIQNTINRQKIFDINVMNTQATQEELNYFNQHGIWPWSQKVIELYEDAIKKNPFVRTAPQQSTNYARTIYNEAAILRVLSYQTKEGQFLINGILIKDDNKDDNLSTGVGDFPNTSGLVERTDDIIKCNMDNETLERIHTTNQSQQTTSINFNDLETIIPGFTFLNKPCNPCKNIGRIPDYSCPYRLHIKGEPSLISSVWQYLWNNTI